MSHKISEAGSLESPALKFLFRLKQLVNDLVKEIIKSSIFQKRNDVFSHRTVLNLIKQMSPASHCESGELQTEMLEQINLTSAMMLCLTKVILNFLFTPMKR